MGPVRRPDSRHGGIQHSLSPSLSLFTSLHSIIIMANRAPLQALNCNVRQPITPAKRKWTGEEEEEEEKDWPPDYEPTSAQRPRPSPTPPPQPPLPATVSLQMLQREFETALSTIDPVLVGPLGGSGTELKMPMQATDRRKLTWRSLARDVSTTHCHQVTTTLLIAVVVASSSARSSTPTPRSPRRTAGSCREECRTRQATQFENWPPAGNEINGESIASCISHGTPPICHQPVTDPWQSPTDVGEDVTTMPKASRFPASIPTTLCGYLSRSIKTTTSANEHVLLGARTSRSASGQIHRADGFPVAVESHCSTRVPA